MTGILTYTDGKDDADSGPRDGLMNVQRPSLRPIVLWSILWGNDLEFPGMDTAFHSCILAEAGVPGTVLKESEASVRDDPLSIIPFLPLSLFHRRLVKADVSLVLSNCADDCDAQRNAGLSLRQSFVSASRAQPSVGSRKSWSQLYIPNLTTAIKTLSKQAARKKRRRVFSQRWDSSTFNTLSESARINMGEMAAYGHPAGKLHLARRHSIRV